MFTVGGRHAKMFLEQGTGCCVDNTAVGAFFMPCSMATGTRCQRMRNYYMIMKVLVCTLHTSIIFNCIKYYFNLVILLKMTKMKLTFAKL